MKRIALVLAALVPACSSAPSTTVATSTVAATTTSVKKGTVPSLTSAAVPLLGHGQFVLADDSAPGTATITQAALVPDPSQPPTTFGTGSMALTLDGTAYDESDTQTFYLVAPDEEGDQYVVVGSIVQDASNDGEVLYLIVKQSDFVAGADVALDGVDRIALFAAGSMNAASPTITAAATSGTIHFSATGPVDATLTATFSTVDWVDDVDGGAPDCGPQSTPDAGPLAVPAPGTYAIAYDLQGVQCDGSMSGQASRFSSVTASSVGLASGTITIAASPAGVDLTGSLATSFGTSDLSLGADPSDGAYAAEVRGDQSLANAANGESEAFDVYLSADPSNPTDVGGAVAITVQSADGSCAILFDATLTRQ